MLLLLNWYLGAEISSVTYIRFLIAYMRFLEQFVTVKFFKIIVINLNIYDNSVSLHHNDVIHPV